MGRKEDKIRRDEEQLIAMTAVSVSLKPFGGDNNYTKVYPYSDDSSQLPKRLKGRLNADEYKEMMDKFKHNHTKEIGIIVGLIVIGIVISIISTILLLVSYYFISSPDDSGLGLIIGIFMVLSLIIPWFIVAIVIATISRYITVIRHRKDNKYMAYLNDKFKEKGFKFKFIKCIRTNLWGNLEKEIISDNTSFDNSQLLYVRTAIKISFNPMEKEKVEVEHAQYTEKK